MFKKAIRLTTFTGGARLKTEGFLDKKFLLDFIDGCVKYPLQAVI